MRDIFEFLIFSRCETMSDSFETGSDAFETDSDALEIRKKSDARSKGSLWIVLTDS